MFSMSPNHQLTGPQSKYWKQECSFICSEAICHQVLVCHFWLVVCKVVSEHVSLAWASWTPYWHASNYQEVPLVFPPPPLPLSFFFFSNIRNLFTFFENDDDVWCLMAQGASYGQRAPWLLWTWWIRVEPLISFNMTCTLEETCQRSEIV